MLDIWIPILQKITLQEMEFTRKLKTNPSRRTKHLPDFNFCSIAQSRALWASSVRGGCSGLKKYISAFPSNFTISSRTFISVMPFVRKNFEAWFVPKWIKTMTFVLKTYPCYIYILMPREETVITTINTQDILSMIFSWPHYWYPITSLFLKGEKQLQRTGGNTLKLTYPYYH